MKLVKTKYVPMGEVFGHSGSPWSKEVQFYTVVPAPQDKRGTEKVFAKKLHDGGDVYAFEPEQLVIY